jgi:hypothetical protein
MRRIPWLVLVLMGLGLVLVCGAWAARTFSLPLPACPLKSYLGLSCATCGMTRCVLALAQGHWAEAFHWHPVAVVLVVASPLAMLWDLRRAWHGYPYPELPDSRAARLGVVGVFLGAWILQIVRGI